MPYTKFQGHQPLGFEEIDEGFYHIWAWKPSWSWDLEHLNKLSFQHPMEAPNEIGLQTTFYYFRKRSLTMSNLIDNPLGPKF